MIVTISGRAGSGKSTVAKLLSQKLGYAHYSIGDLRRHIAHERGMSLEAYNALGERDRSTDRDPDEYQKRLGREQDNFVIDGRLSFHFIPHSLKVFLDARLEVRAERVFRDERKAEHFHSLEDAKRALLERERSDAHRYQSYYGLDCNDHQHYDLVIDTSAIPVEEVVERILAFVRRREADAGPTGS